jgi:hypothetical protein
MIINFTQAFKKKAAKLCQKQGKLQAQLKKQFRIFQKDPSYVGLHVHKLRGKRSQQYAIWIIDDLRALAIKDGDSYIFFDLVTHDEY